jgi:hypothetical protein
MPESLKKISAAVLEDLKKALASQWSLQNSFTSAFKFARTDSKLQSDGKFRKVLPVLERSNHEVLSVQGRDHSSLKQRPVQRAGQRGVRFLTQRGREAMLAAIHACQSQGRAAYIDRSRPTCPSCPTYRDHSSYLGL